MRLFGSFADEPHGGGGIALPDLSGFHHGLPGGFLLLDHLPSHRVAGSAEASDVCFAFAVWVKAFGLLHSPSSFKISSPFINFSRVSSLVSNGLKCDENRQCLFKLVVGVAHISIPFVDGYKLLISSMVLKIKTSFIAFATSNIAT